MNKINCGWGDPYFLLDILSKQAIPLSVNLKDCTYAPDAGDSDLLLKIKDITKKLTGHEYKYFIITNGATQAINTIMRVWEEKHNVQIVLTSKFGFPYYPMMIEKSKLSHNKVDFKTYNRSSQERCFNHMSIIDSPSNPLGEQYFKQDNDGLNGYLLTVWDAVYHNPIYNACPIIQPPHDVYVGSFSKLLGLTGARIGWIATDNSFDYQLFLKESLYETATVSKISQQTINQILSTMDLDDFMKVGKTRLDLNRHTLHKLSGLIGSDVQEKGMFYLFQADKKMFKLFDKAGIIYVKLSDEDKQYIRLNIGQTAEVLTDAVKAVLKTDRRK